VIGQCWSEDAHGSHLFIEGSCTFANIGIEMEPTLGKISGLGRTVNLEVVLNPEVHLERK